jgi:hypothetical protein
MSLQQDTSDCRGFSDIFMDQNVMEPTVWKRSLLIFSPVDFQMTGTSTKYVKRDERTRDQDLHVALFFLVRTYCTDFERRFIYGDLVDCDRALARKDAILGQNFANLPY